jgi:glyoxylase-like metal-dependent hydrolase (beta-lactamase superfamily II)
MFRRKYIFPNVLELNVQAGRRLGVNLYLIDGGSEFLLIDIGWEDTVTEIIDLLRKMDFSLATCKMVIASHADLDHIQGLATFRDLLRTKVAAHPNCVDAIQSGDGELTFARIKAQKIDVPLKPCKVDILLNEGDIIQVGNLRVQVWHTPGHTSGQLSFKLGNLLFVGDNIYKDSCVGVIDAHHGSNLPHFVESLHRIRDDDSEFLLPSHGPVFRRDNTIIQKAIDRLTGYQYLADFGTCAVEWPLEEEWDRNIEDGRIPDTMLK